MKNLYIYPPILVVINFFIIMFFGSPFVRREMKLLDYILILVGIFLTILFALLLFLSHKIKQIHMKPRDVDKLVTDGPYSIIRHPNFAGIIYMNFAFFLFLRTFWLIPAIIVFIFIWFFEARYEENILIKKFGESYKEYMKKTGMFLPKIKVVKEVALRLTARVCARVRKLKS